MDHTYTLQRYAGLASRHTCPRCNRPHCFTRYVDEAGHELADSVGRCDHESSCGYHYTPRQYFSDHPELRPLSLPVSRVDKVDRVAAPVPPKPIDTIPAEILQRTVHPSRDSHFTTFLSSLFDPAEVESLVIQYRLGVTRDRSVIFYQIDTAGRIRTGKIMKYDPETGHRIKDPSTPNRITWVHSLLKQLGKLPRTWALSQCLFGEHLLAEYPDKPVALVESEKTAVICAGLIPRYLWLATGGKSQLSAARLAPLAGRRVTAFPDIDAYELWCEKLGSLSSCPAPTGHHSITVSDLLQRNATPTDREAHIDLADWLIRWKKGEPTSFSTETLRTFEAIAQYFDPAHHEELKNWIEDFGLELV
jgi:hypothetical protein